MAKRTHPRGPSEPLILRLQLELKTTRRAAEACARAGFRSAAEVAAAEDSDFHNAVRLAPKDRAALLSRAREPGSKAPEAGAPPVLTRDRRPTEAIVKMARPVGLKVKGLAGEPIPRGEPPRGPKPAPPEGKGEKRRLSRTAALEIEAELDETLSKGS